MRRRTVGRSRTRVQRRRIEAETVPPLPCTAVSGHASRAAPSRARGSPPDGCRPGRGCSASVTRRSEEHTSELQSHHDLVCRLLLEKKKKKYENKRAQCSIVTIHQLTSQ